MIDSSWIDPVRGGKVLFSLSLDIIVRKRAQCRCGCFPCICRFIEAMPNHKPPTEDEKLQSELNAS